MNIIAETAEWIAVEKPPSLVSECTDDGKGLGNLLAQRNGGYIGVIHRLDRGVGGVILYAKTPDCAAELSRAAQEHCLSKRYLAVVEGALTQTAEEAVELRDLLFFDRRKNKTYAVERRRNGVKEAILRYRCLDVKTVDGAPLSLVEVEPVTGRTHQIRAQFATRRMPVLGDRRYGGSPLKREDGGVALICHTVTVPPVGTSPEVTVKTSPVGDPWDWFEI